MTTTNASATPAMIARHARMIAADNDPMINAICSTISSALIDADDAPINSTADFDLIAALDALPIIMTQPAADLIHAMIDFCPIHTCDQNICADDDITDCAIFRS